MSNDKWLQAPPARTLLSTTTPLHTKNAQTGGSTATARLLPGAAPAHSTASTPPTKARPS